MPVIRTRLASLLLWLLAAALAQPGFSRQVGSNVGIQQPQALTDFDAATNRLTAAWANYDNAGNLSHFKFPGSAAFDWTAAYDAENKQRWFCTDDSAPCTQANAEYRYDGQGQRVQKILAPASANPTAITYVYDAFGKLAAEYSTAPPTTAGGTYYRTTDHLGSTRLVTDAQGDCKVWQDFYPFGERILGNASTGRESWTCYGGAGTDPFEQEFTSKERDTESNLDYFGARYFSASLGRFTGADTPFADQKAANPQSWNLYSYVGNNPLAYTDPSGRGKLSVFFRVATKVLPDGRIFKKITNKRLSRDEARRLFRKDKQDVFGSRKGAKNVAGRDPIEDPIHGRGAGDNNPHFHDADRSGPHSFYSGAGVIVPGASLGADLFGDNVVGQAVDFLNPLGDVQDVVDLVDAGTEVLHESAVDFVNEQMRQGMLLPCFGCTPPQTVTPEDAGKGAGEAPRPQQCAVGEEGCVTPN